MYCRSTLNISFQLCVHISNIYRCLQSSRMYRMDIFRFSSLHDSQVLATATDIWKGVLRQCGKNKKMLVNSLPHNPDF